MKLARPLFRPRARRAFCTCLTEAFCLQTLAHSILALTSQLGVMLGVTTLLSGLLRLQRASWAQRCLSDQILHWTTTTSELLSTVFIPSSRVRGRLLSLFARVGKAACGITARLPRRSEKQPIIPARRRSDKAPQINHFVLK